MGPAAVVEPRMKKPSQREREGFVMPTDLRQLLMISAIRPEARAISR